MPAEQEDDDDLSPTLVNEDLETGIAAVEAQREGLQAILALDDVSGEVRLRCEQLLAGLGSISCALANLASEAQRGAFLAGVYGGMSDQVVDRLRDSVPREDVGRLLGTLHDTTS